MGGWLEPLLRGGEALRLDWHRTPTLRLQGHQGHQGHQGRLQLPTCTSLVRTAPRRVENVAGVVAEMRDDGLYINGHPANVYARATAVWREEEVPREALLQAAFAEQQQAIAHNTFVGRARAAFGLVLVLAAPVALTPWRLRTMRR